MSNKDWVFPGKQYKTVMAEQFDKPWFAIEHQHTGEPTGIICSDCFPDRNNGHVIRIEITKRKMGYECHSCGKAVKDHYSFCVKCEEVFPKSEALDKGKFCVLCEHAI